MTQFDVSIVINSPVDIVVDALMNHKNFVYWQTNLEKFEVIKETEEKVGSIAHLHYNEKGRKYIMEDKMIQYEPNKKIVSQVSGDVISAVVETIILSQGDKTEIKLKWSGEGKVFFVKLLLPLLKGKMIKQSAKELETFKHLVETRGSDFNSSKI
jgi:hypothetical protein